MTLQVAALLGVQEPRLCSAPPSVSSAGVEAIELAAMAGLILDPWQAFCMERMLGERSDGKWSAFEAGILVARQNGKGAILEARALAGLFLFDEEMIVWSAHEFKTAKWAFRRMERLIKDCPELYGRVARRGSQVTGFRQSNEDTSIELADGRRLQFMARNKNAGRGFTGDCQILDEAQELPSVAVDAMMPTLSARPNPQLIYTGTVPGPTNDGEHFERVRDRGRAGDDPSLAWMEWTPAGDPAEVDLDDREAWTLSNPALGYRLNEEALDRERASMSEEGFGRERLSLWGVGGSRAVIDMDAWGALTDPGSQPLDPVAFAIDVTPDRSSSSIGVAGYRADGLRHIELVANDRGTGWVLDVMVQAIKANETCAVMIDATGPAASLIPALTEAGVALSVVSARGMGQACGLIYDGVAEGAVRHLGQVPLDSALGAARKRKLGDLWAWHRSTVNVDISPLVAVTLALLGLDQYGAAKKAPSFVPRRIR